MNKLCLLSMVYELRFDHLPLFHSLALMLSHTNLCVTCTPNTHTHLMYFSECVKLYSVTLGKVASQSKIINVWNISSLIFEQVHSSDFAWWWCIIKCWHNITIFCLWTPFSLSFSIPDRHTSIGLVWQSTFIICHKCTVGCPQPIVYNSSHRLTIWGNIKAAIQHWISQSCEY